MSNPIDLISRAISTNTAGQEWRVEKSEACTAHMKLLTRCQQGQGFQVTALNKTPSGAELVFSGNQSTNGTFTLFMIQFRTNRSGTEVEIQDSTLGAPPDGKLAPDEVIRFDNAFLRLDNRGKCGKTFTLVSVGGISKYHGLEFKREGDLWKFVGPRNRRERGIEAEKILNSATTEYAKALVEAESRLLANTSEFGPRIK